MSSLVLFFLLLILLSCSTGVDGEILKATFAAAKDRGQRSTVDRVTYRHLGIPECCHLTGFKSQDYAHQSLNSQLGWSCVELALMAFWDWTGPINVMEIVFAIQALEMENLN
ncbi:unnamed protein product [Caretta caretta]